MSHNVRGRVVRGGGDKRRSKVFQQSESAQRRCLRGCWTSAASDTLGCPNPVVEGHSPETRIPAESWKPRLWWDSNPPGLSLRTGFWPLGGLELNQKPAFLPYSFNQENEKLQTHSQQMEQPQMGTEEVCYSWPKTEYVKEMQQFKCEVCNIRQTLETKTIAGITWLDSQRLTY